MALSTTINYDTPANFTYDSDLIEVLTSAKLKALVYANEIFYNNFAQTTALRGGGTLVPTAVTASIVGGKLACLSNTYIEYPAGANVGITTSGCIRFKLTPNYSGTPAGTQNIFCIQDNGVSLVNTIQIIHNTGGSLVLSIYNSSGVAVLTPFAAWTPVAGTEYNFHINFDIVSGYTKLYIDGVEKLSSSSTGTRANTATRLMIGKIGSTVSSNFTFDDLQIFSAVKTVEASWNEQYHYSIANPSIVVASGVTADALVSFLATANTTGSDTVKFTLVNSDELYWDGSSWSVGNGTYAQSSTIADVIANIASLDISSGAIIKIKAYLHSDDGYSTPELVSASIEYDFYAIANSIAYCYLYAYVYDNGIPVSGAKIVIKSRTINYSQANFNKTSVVEYTNASGYFEKRIFKAGADTPLSVEISFVNSRNEQVLRKFDIRITSETYAALDDIIVS